MTAAAAAAQTIKDNIYYATVAAIPHQIHISALHSYCGRL